MESTMGYFANHGAIHLGDRGPFQIENIDFGGLLPDIHQV